MSEKKTITLSCDITRDLVPSFLEAICSQDSVEAVEAHLAQCAKCSAYVAHLRQTAVEGAGANLKAVDSMKKMRRYYDKKVIAHLLGILSAALTAFWCLRGLFHLQFIVYETAFPVMVVLLLFLLKDGRVYRETRKSRRIAAALSLAGCAYVLGITGIFYSTIAMEQAPFGMPMQEVGPFLHYQFMAAVVLEIAVFLWSLRDSMQKDNRLGWVSVASLAVTAYGMAINEMLYLMDNADSVLAQCWGLLFVFGVEAALLCGVTAVCARPMPDNPN